MPKPPRFDNPISHSSDPSSSRRAGKDMTESGRRLTNARIVYRLLKEHPGCTAVELFEKLPRPRALKEHQEVRRRLTDLKAAGCVRQGAQRHCQCNGTKMVTWYVHGPFTNMHGETRPATLRRQVFATIACLEALRVRLPKGSRRVAVANICHELKEGRPPDVEYIRDLLKG